MTWEKFVGKVSFKRDIDSEIARLRANGYKQAKKIPHGLTGDRNRCFVKLFSEVLNIYAIINEYGRVYYHFDLQKGPFLKMVKELEAVTELYKKYNKIVRPYFRKYEGKLIGQKETKDIFALTKKNKRLMEKAGRRRLDFLRKYRDFYELCVRFTSTPDGIFLHLFRVGQSMKKSDRSLFFKFFDAVLEHFGAYVEMAGRPAGTGVYTTEVRKDLLKAYSTWKEPCRKIYNELMNCSSPYEKARELAIEYELPVTLLRDVAETGSLTNFTLSVAYWDVFDVDQSIPLNYLRKVLPGKILRTV